MTYNKKSVEDVAVKGKKVLVRCDFNVPVKDGVITVTDLEPGTYTFCVQYNDQSYNYFTVVVE